MTKDVSNQSLSKSKKKKNFAMLAMIAAWVVLIWVVTMIKVKTGTP